MKSREQQISDVNTILTGLAASLIRGINNGGLVEFKMDATSVETSKDMDADGWKESILEEGFTFCVTLSVMK